MAASNWKEVATLNSNGQFNDTTIGAANGLAQGVVLEVSEGGTGVSSLSAGLLTYTNGGFQTVQVTNGEVLTVDANGELTTTSDLSGTHDHDADYVSLSETSFSGNLEMTGTLSVGGSISAASGLDISTTTNSTYILNNDQAMAGDGEYGLQIDDTAGAEGDAALLYIRNAANDGGSWKVRADSINSDMLTVITSSLSSGTPIATASSYPSGTLCTDSDDSGAIFIAV